MVYLWGLVWALPSFLLHNVIHEGAHALVARMNGAKITRFWPFPGRSSGYFTWASVGFTHVSRGYALLCVAPIFAELLWLALVLPLVWVTRGVLHVFLVVEVVSANVDIITWLLGYWNPRINMNCDAELFRSEMGFSRLTGKLLSLGHLAVMALCLYVVIRSW